MPKKFIPKDHKKFTPKDLKGFDKLVKHRKIVADLEKDMANQSEAMGMDEKAFMGMIGGLISRPVPKFHRGKGTRRSPAPKKTPAKPVVKSQKKEIAKAVAARVAKDKKTVAKKKPAQTNKRPTRKK